MYVNMVENRAEPTQYFKPVLNEVRRVMRSGVTQILSHTHIHSHAHAQIWTIRTFFIQMRQTLTHSCSQARTHARKQTCSCMMLTHIHKWPTHTKHHQNRVHTPSLTHTHIQHMKHTHTPLMYVRAKHNKKTSELNEFAKIAKQLVLRIHTKLHIEWDNTHSTFIVFN